MVESKNQLLQKVKAEFVELSGDEETRRLEELKDKWERDYKSGLSYAKKQGQEEIAKEMLENGEEIEKIIKYTKLTKQEIERLKDRN